MIRLVSLLLVVLLVSCGEAPFYVESFSIDNGQWDSGITADFDFEIKSTEMYYDLVLDVEHGVDYTYENIYVKIHTTFPTGEKVEDQVSLQLADKLDQWEGKCSGDKCKVSILLQNRVRFKDVGQHKIEIEQFNREDPLEGINGLTLKIVENTGQQG